MKPKTITICAHCSDRFSALLDTGEEYQGYVPDFFPEDHYGDSVRLQIDLETGKIENWIPPTQEDLDKIFESEEELREDQVW